MRYVMITCLLVALMASPALAALKMLPDEVARDLEQIAIEHVAADLDVNIDELEVSEAWVRELWHTGVDIYIVIVMAGDEKIGVHVHVDERTVLTEEEFEQLVAAEEAAAPEDAVRITTLGLTDEPEEGAAGRVASQATMYYVAGGAALAAAAAGALLRRRRAS